ncbi:MAG: DUF4440 domain-containing protein [Betaproteobacteria bacterium]
MPRPFAAKCATIPLVVLALTGCATMASDASRRSLVDAERAFARMSAERGIRPAFLASFADDGIGFNPAPYRLREAWSARPPQANPKQNTLDWHPVISGVARSGTLGFTAGPSLFVDTTGALPPSNGVYFSVWRRGPDGVWKVAADAGIETPRALTDADFGADPVVASTTATAIGANSLDDADAKASGGAAAFASALASDARWHVDGRVPLVGRERVAAARAADARTLRFVTQGREAAPTSDLGYTVGAIDAAGVPAGHYLHLWAREGDGAWRLVVAVHLAPA